MKEVPPVLPLESLHTHSLISASIGTASFTGLGSTFHGMGSPVGGTLPYNPSRLLVCRSKDW